MNLTCLSFSSLAPAIPRHDHLERSDRIDSPLEATQRALDGLKRTIPSQGQQPQQGPKRIQIVEEKGKIIIPPEEERDRSLSIVVAAVVLLGALGMWRGRSVNAFRTELYKKIDELPNATVEEKAVAKAYVQGSGLLTLLKDVVSDGNKRQALTNIVDTANIRKMSILEAALIDSSSFGTALADKLQAQKTTPEPPPTDVEAQAKQFNDAVGAVAQRIGIDTPAGRILGQIRLFPADAADRLDQRSIPDLRAESKRNDIRKALLDGLIKPSDLADNDPDTALVRQAVVDGWISTDPETNIKIVKIVRALSRSAAETASKYPRGVREATVGDLHGSWQAYNHNLRRAGVIDAQGKWAFGKGSVHFMGDIVADRHADGMKILLDIARLRGEAKQAGGQIVVYAGNHENFLLSYLAGDDVAGMEGKGLGGLDASIQGDGQGKGIFELLHFLPPERQQQLLNLQHPPTRQEVQAFIDSASFDVQSGTPEALQKAKTLIAALTHRTEILATMRSHPKGKIVLRELLAMKLITTTRSGVLRTHTPVTLAMAERILADTTGSINAQHDDYYRQVLLGEGNLDERALQDAKATIGLFTDTSNRPGLEDDDIITLWSDDPQAAEMRTRLVQAGITTVIVGHDDMRRTDVDYGSSAQVKDGITLITSDKGLGKRKAPTSDTTPSVVIRTTGNQFLEGDAAAKYVDEHSAPRSQPRGAQVSAQALPLDTGSTAQSAGSTNQSPDGILSSPQGSSAQTSVTVESPKTEVKIRRRRK